MSYDLYIQRRIDEIEEKLLTKVDPIERLYLWFSFVKDFSPETHSLLDMQYTELVQLSQLYVNIPDPVARKELRRQIKSCVSEIENINEQLKRIPPLQGSLEHAVVEHDYGDEKEN